MSKAEKELDEFEQIFTALSHETRRHILVVLNARKGEMTAGEIVDRFSYRWPTITRHLQHLESVGLITVQKLGRERRYILNKTKLVGVIDGWIKWFK